MIDLLLGLLILTRDIQEVIYLPMDPLLLSNRLCRWNKGVENIPGETKFLLQCIKVFNGYCILTQSLILLLQ